MYKDYRNAPVFNDDFWNVCGGRIFIPGNGDVFGNYRGPIVLPNLKWVWFVLRKVIPKMKANTTAVIKYKNKYLPVAKYYNMGGFRSLGTLKVQINLESSLFQEGLWHNDFESAESLALAQAEYFSMNYMGLIK